MLPYLLVLVSICTYKTCLGHVPDSAWSIQLYCVWDMSQTLKAHGNQASVSVTVCYSLCRTMAMSLMPEACCIPPYIRHMVYMNKTSSCPCPRTRYNIQCTYTYYMSSDGTCTFKGTPYVKIFYNLAKVLL